VTTATLLLLPSSHFSNKRDHVDAQS